MSLNAHFWGHESLCKMRRKSELVVMLALLRHTDFDPHQHVHGWMLQVSVCACEAIIHQ